MKEALDSYGVNGDRLTENRLRVVLDEFQISMNDRFRNMDMIVNNNNNINNSNDIGRDENEIENGRGYQLLFYDEKWQRVPADWRFSRCRIQDLWRQR